MAAVSPSGLSIALGVYNTTQIASLKETLDAISGSGRGGSPSALSTTVIQAPVVIHPVETINKTSFREASSSEIKELQERLDELETFSNSVSSSSASNSTNMSQSVGSLANKLSELEMFANTSSTRSSTNESKIVMIDDEVDRLTSFTAEEITSVRDRVARAEESVATNASNVNMLSTRAGGVETGVSDANSRIDAVLALSTAVESSLEATKASVVQSAESIGQVSTAVTGLTMGVDTLGGAIALVDGNETETRENLATLLDSWNELRSRATFTNGSFKAVNLLGYNCRLELGYNDAQKYALNFGSMTDPDFTMYASNPTGKGPDGKNPVAHGDVTSRAVRLRINSDTKCGFVVENAKNEGVFSVNTEGKTRMASGKIADFDGGTTVFAHHARHSVQGYAIAQKKTGQTLINSAKGQTLELRTDNKAVAYVHGDKFYVKKPASGPNHGNISVYDSIASLNAKVASLNSTVMTLAATLDTIKANYVDKRKTVRMYNHVSKAYLRNGGDNNAVVDGGIRDTKINFSILHN